MKPNNLLGSNGVKATTEGHAFRRRRVETHLFASIMLMMQVIYGTELTRKKQSELLLSHHHHHHRILILEMRSVERGVCPIVHSHVIMNELFQ